MTMDVTGSSRAAPPLQNIATKPGSAEHNRTQDQPHTHHTADSSSCDYVSILGVPIANLDQQQALDWLQQQMDSAAAAGVGQPISTRTVCIVNAHTLNLACEDADYHRVLRDADRVFGDGTGVRWAARGRGQTIKANLVGTDLMPALFEATAEQGYRYFLLGADPQTLEHAVDYCQRQFPGWQLAGHHHGYLDDPQTNAAAIAAINASGAHLLLVGMGNPRQETWLDRHRAQLTVPVGVGVGGLFDHWGGNLKRAPLWVRRAGYEWLQLLLQQPHKASRYLLGNPKFLLRIWRQRGRDLALTAALARTDAG